MISMKRRSSIFKMVSIEFLTERGFALSLENGRLAVSPKGKLTESLRKFIREQKENLVLQLRRRKLELLLSRNNELREQFAFEIEERISLMVIDGEISEAESLEVAKESTFQIWLILFGD
jgi:hypothetical protein